MGLDGIFIILWMISLGTRARKYLRV